MKVEDPRAQAEKTADSIAVEVVLAQPEAQWRASMTLPVGSRLRDALAASGVDSQLGGDRRWQDFAIGVFGRLRTADSILADGDRIELYRPLTADPKEARRKRVRKAGR